MNHTISLSEKTEQALRALADEQGMTEEEYLRRLIEAWGAGLPEGERDPIRRGSGRRNGRQERRLRTPILPLDVPVSMTATRLF